METLITETEIVKEEEKRGLPRPFIIRRLHSILGVWLAVYLCQHLLVNSQAALFIKDGGEGFVTWVNRIHEIPYLRAVELLVLAVPFLAHGVWGIFYALTSKTNSFSTKGKTPSLPQYRRNRAFTWQRVTSWILLVAILGHVLQMRLIHYPEYVQLGNLKEYMIPVSKDRGLALVAEKLKIKLYTAAQIGKLESEYADRSGKRDASFEQQYRLQEEANWLRAAENANLKEGQVLAVAPNPGSAFFLVVREIFKDPLMVVLYSIFVIAAGYHAFNGIWTAMITWGITLTRRSQAVMRKITSILMGIVIFLGLIAAWGPYWTYLFIGK